MNNKNVIALPASANYTPEQALLSALDLCREVMLIQLALKNRNEEQ